MSESQTINSRLGKFIDHLNLSQNEFAKTVGISSPLISQMLNKNSNFGIDTLKKIIDKYPLFNTEWLIKGEGNMLHPSNNNNTLINTTLKIPVIDAKKQINYINNADLKNFPEMVLPSHEFFNPKTGSFQVNSDNMMPALYAGDYVISEFCQNWKHNLIEGQVYIIITPKSILFNRFKEYAKNALVFENDNIDYPEITLNHNDIKEIWQVKSKLSFYLKKQNNNNFNSLLKATPNNYFTTEAIVPKNETSRYNNYLPTLFSNLMLQKIAVFYYGNFSPKIILSLKERIKKSVATHFKNNIKIKKRIYNLCIELFSQLPGINQETETFFSLMVQESVYISMGTIHTIQFAENLIAQLSEHKTKTKAQKIKHLKSFMFKDDLSKEDEISMSLITLALQSENSFETFYEQIDETKALFILKIKLNDI